MIMRELNQMDSKQKRISLVKRSQFLSAVKKEFLYILRDRWTMIILLVLPILMVILFGFGISTEIRNTGVAVFSPSHDVATQKIVNKLASSEYFIIDRYLSDISEVETALKKGDIGLVVVFGDNFAENLERGNADIQLIADGSDPNTATSLVNYATAIIRQSTAQQTDNNIAISRITCQTKLLYNPTMKGAYNIVPGVLGLVLMLICTMMTSIAIAREKETGTMEILLVSPIKPATIILSKTVPFFVLSLVNLATVLLLSVFVLKVPIAGSLSLLIGVSMLYIFLCLSLGVLISIVAPSQMVAMLVSAVVLMLPTMLLSGLLFPIENMPLVLQWLAQILPIKWYIVAIRNVMIKGVGLATISREVIVLCVMTVFLLVVSLKKFNKRIE